MFIEIKEVNMFWTVVMTDIHWVNGFTGIIKIAIKDDRDVESFVDLRNINWIYRIFDIV